MHHSVPEAASLLGVSEDLIYDWIRNEGLPATFFGGRYHLNHLKLIDWAYRNQFPLPVEGSVTAPVLEEALQRGGVLLDIPGEDLGKALEEIVFRRLGLEPNVRKKILGMLQTRENFGWSVDEKGIGMPSSQSPLVVLPESSRVYIAYLSHPREDSAQQKLPHVLFIILVSAHPMHLNLLSRCKFVLRDRRFQELLAEQSGVEALLQCMRVLSVEPLPARPHDNGAIDLS